MAWFDEPEKYYGELKEQEALNQGDILVAPTTVLLTGRSETGVVGPSDVDEVRQSTVWIEAADQFPAAPAMSALSRWGLAMVIPHACAMEKEWNERVSELIKDGLPEADALSQASADDTLDPYVTIAPILPLNEVDPSKRVGILANQRLGNFPVCASAHFPAAYVDLNQLTTVHYSLATRAQRIACLSPLALAHFHHSLVMHFAYRGYAGFANLQKAVGNVISDVRISSRAKNRIIVDFILADGTTLTLESVDTGKPANAPDRPPR